MAGRKMWTSKAVSVTSSIFSGKGWVGAFALVTKGTSTPSAFRLKDSTGGTCRLSYRKIKSGTASGGLTGTSGDSEFHNIDRPIFFSKKCI